MKKLIRRLIAPLRGRQLLIDLPTRKPTVFLTSSGRSGSTWIQNLLSYKRNVRTLFEPFHNKETKEVRDWNYFQYIYRYDKNDKFKTDANKIVSGRARNKWVDVDNTAKFPTSRLIKDIRSNLFVAWLKENFPHLELIYLIRHPFSVAESAVSLGWQIELEDRLAQTELISRHFTSDQALFRNLQTPFAKHVACWVIDNLVALRELDSEDAIAISYEDFKAQPEEEANRLFAHVSFEKPTGLKEVIAKKSRTTDLERRNPKFRASQQEIDEAFALLVHFGLDRVYTLDRLARPKLGERDLLSEYTFPQTNVTW